jgi:hypothetical protein
MNREIKNKDEVLDHLKNYGDSPIIMASTIKDGYVSCVGPVKTICGPEFYCNANTISSLNNMIDSWWSGQLN